MVATALAVFKKDFGIYLKSFSVYAAAAVFLAISGYFFFWELNYFSLVCYRVAANPHLEYRGFNLTESVLSTFFMNMGVVLLLMMPVLTMRAFAEERKQGTLETLLTYPAGETGILLGKFTAVWLAALLMVSPTFIFVLLAQAAGGYFDAGVLVTAYLGLILLSGSFAALGVLTSVLTDSQLVSAVMSFGFLIFLWMIGWGAEILSKPGADWLRALSLFEHYRNLTKGIIYVRDLAYFTLFITFFLLVARELVGVRRWRA